MIGQDPDGEPAFYLRVQCTAEANERVLGATGEHVDQSVVVLFDGEVRNVSVVKNAVGCQNMTLGWPASEEEARRMEEKVRGVWSAEG